MQIALAKSRRPEDLSRLLVNEVQTLTQDNSRKSSLATTKMLLDGGADVNQGPALCQAVSSGHTAITDALLESPKPPNQATLDTALPHTLKLSDLMDRLSFTQKLIAAGASPLQINRGLVHAVEHYTDDIPLLGVLAEKADTADGEALTMAVSKQASDVIDLLLSKSKHTLDVKHAALTRAMSIRDRSARRKICARLLKDGISKDEASNALLIAARDGDIELGNTLMVHGASISSNGGQAIIEACRGGNAEVVEILLRSEGQVHKSTLEKAFQAATEVGDLTKRAVIFEKLLKRGVAGEPVNAQLSFAARYGESGHEVLRVLLAAGADPNHHSGEAVLVATRTASTRNLELLLGLWDQEGKQKKPSQPTLLRAFKACWALNRDTRYKIIRDLCTAGMPAVDDVHAALNDAINEQDSEDRLVQLLLDHGASPIANECKTLIDAVKQGASSSLGILVSRPLPAEALNYAFAETYTPTNFESWFSWEGMQTVRVLLEHGAEGGALSQMALQVMNKHTHETADLADEFVILLTTHGLDVNYNSGEPLQVAASQANVNWTKQLLALHPSTEALSFAFQHIFDTALDQDDALQLFQLFADYREGETRVDVMAQKPDAAPVLVQAMTQYPRSLVILKTLLDTGFYHDQATFYSIYDDIDEQEQMTLLTWAIAQPQKKISSSLIELLLDRGGKFAPFLPSC
jgi:ankyrin repeat protein